MTWYLGGSSSLASGVSGVRETLCVITHHLSVFFAGWLQAYMYLGEGERLLKSLTNEDSWSQTFEYATFYSLKAEVRTH
jgi:hypothetical protein